MYIQCFSGVLKIAALKHAKKHQQYRSHSRSTAYTFLKDTDVEQIHFSGNISNFSDNILRKTLGWLLLLSSKNNLLGVYLAISFPA